MDFNRTLLTERPDVFLKKPVVSLVYSHYRPNILKVFFCQQFRSGHLLGLSASLVIGVICTNYCKLCCRGMNK